MKALLKGKEVEFRRDFSCLEAILDSVIESYPDRGFGYISLDGSEEFFTFSEIKSLALRYLNGLNKLGVKEGDVVGIETSNPKEFHLGFWACMLGGIVGIPISTPRNWTYSSDQIQGLLRLWDRLDKPMIVTEQSHLDLYLDLKENQDLEELMVVGIDDLLDDEEASSVERDLEEVSYMLLSSGSTGDPKAICLSQKAMIYSSLSTADSLGLEDDDIAISWLPHTHNLGLFLPMVVGAMCHNSGYFMAPSTYMQNTKLFLEKIEEHKATWFCTNNSGLALLSHRISDEEAKELDLSSLKSMFPGGERITRSAIESFYEKFKVSGVEDGVIQPGYGLSEMTCASCLIPADQGNMYVSVDRIELLNGSIVDVPEDNERSSIFASVGFPMSGVDKKIVDEDGNTVDENMVGELMTRSQGCYKGHYNHGLTPPKDIDDQGWLATGDLAFARDNNVFIVGRIKDVIIIRGVNYIATDIDKLASEADTEVPPGGIACAGVKTEKGEEVMILVEFSGSLEDFIPLRNKIKSYIGDMLGLNVQKIFPVDQVPKTSSGKIQRFKMELMYEEGEFKEVEEELAQLMDSTDQEVDSEFLPETDLEHLVCDAVAKTLNLKKEAITLDLSFSSLGGESIDFYRLLSDLNDELGIEIDQGIAMRANTLEEMVEYLEDELEKENA